VLEQGRVIELGTHEELMAAGGRYHTMFELQASRFGTGEGGAGGDGGAGGSGGAGAAPGAPGAPGDHCEAEGTDVLD
jgi:hypothetical protein